MSMTMATSSFAAVSCSKMKAISIIASEGISSGGQVIFKNTGTSSTCGGNLAANGNQKFPLPSNTADKTMALILTGMSLTKTFVLWADFTTTPSVPTLVSVSLEDQ